MNTRPASGPDPSDLLNAVALRRQRAPSKKDLNTLAFSRELGPGDIEELENPAPEAGTGTAYNAGNGMGLQRIRHSHHLLAMVLAEGANTAKAAALTGYSPQTINQLSIDPTFKELVAHYHTATMAEYEELKRRAAALGLSFIDELQSRLEESPDSFPNSELAKFGFELLDRSILPSKGGPGGAPQGGAKPTPLMRIEFVAAAQAPQGAQAPTLEARVNGSRVELGEAIEIGGDAESGS